MAVPKLTTQQRIFIIRRLACYEDPSKIVSELYTEFGITVGRPAVFRYDPTKSAGARSLGKKWVELFHTCRKAFLDEVTGTIPEANKAVRVRMLAEAARTAERKNDPERMADMLERIAKEMGDVHTNRREYTGKNGGPIQYEEVANMTDEQIDREIRGLTTKLGYDKASVVLPDDDGEAN